MAEILSAAERVVSGEMTVIDYICEVSAFECSTEMGKDRPSDRAYWEMVRDAQKNGKKLIFINGPVPLEIIYALDCVPLYLDLLPSRLSANTELTTKLINTTETHANASLCSLNKTNMGIILRGNLGLEPDAYVSVPISCDSGRAACSEMSRYINAPVMNFDVPLRKDESGLRYVEMQLKRLIEFLENISGNKLDWEQVKYRCELSNRSATLLDNCAQLRRNKPCPLSSRLTVWNEFMNAFSPTEEMGVQLEQEIKLCEERISKGFSPCPLGEKHRIVLFHNLLWQGIDLTAWLEKEYGSTTVIDGFCFGKRELFTKLDNAEDCFAVMSRRMMKGAMAHGTGVSGGELLESLEGVLVDYEPDVFVFMGSAGCRHAWAETKMVSDSIQTKYGKSMLCLDIDNTNRNYKSENEIKTALSEYMDTVINKK